MSPEQMYFEDVEVGAPLPPLTRGPLAIKDLVKFGAATDDWSEIHFDEAVVRQRGLPAPLVHGPLKAAYLAQMLNAWMGPAGALAPSLPVSRDGRSRRDHHLLREGRRQVVRPGRAPDRVRGVDRELDGGDHDPGPRIRCLAASPACPAPGAGPEPDLADHRRDASRPAPGRSLRDLHLRGGPPLDSRVRVRVRRREPAVAPTRTTPEPRDVSAGSLRRRPSSAPWTPSSAITPSATRKSCSSTRGWRPCPTRIRAEETPPARWSTSSPSAPAIPSRSR